MRGLVGDARTAPQRAHPRRGGRGRRAPVAPLHLRPPAAGQIGQRARYGLRAGGAWPDGHPAGRRRCQRRDRRSSTTEIGSARAREPSPAPITPSALEELHDGQRQARRARLRSNCKTQWDRGARTDRASIRDNSRTSWKRRRGRRQPRRLLRKVATHCRPSWRGSTRTGEGPGRDAADAGLSSTPRRSPKWSRAGPAFRSARWSTTRSAPCCR